MSNILKYQNSSSPLLIQQVNQSGANFVKRLLDPDRKSIPDWETKGTKIATHKLGWAEDDQGAYVYPEVQEINEQLIDFSRPPYAPGIADYLARKNNNIVRMSPEEADWFTKNYKQYYPSFKKGGNIHIKKKNRGKFTEYCGGKVTEECIAKGKNSKDPKIRKRATFAANARKWKHEDGGILKAQGGSGQSFWPTLETSLQKTGLVPKETHINVPMYTYWDGHTSIEVPLEEAERAFGFYRNVMPSETIPSAEELQNIANKEIIFSDIKDNWKDHVNDDDVKSLFGIISNDTQKFIGSLPTHFSNYVKGDKDISDTINITAPNTDISKFIFGNKISKDAIEEISRVAKLRNQDPYDILAHMLIEGSGSEPLTTHSYYNTHDVVQKQINPSLYNNYKDSDTILKQLGIYNGKKIPNINVIKKAYEKVKTKRDEAVKNLKVPESGIDAVALRMLLHGRDFNPAQKGLKGVWTEGTVKNTYLDMIDSAIKSLKENMPDLFN